MTVLEQPLEKLKGSIQEISSGKAVPFLLKGKAKWNTDTFITLPRLSHFQYQMLYNHAPSADAKELSMLKKLKKRYAQANSADLALLIKALSTVFRAETENIESIIADYRSILIPPYNSTENFKNGLFLTEMNIRSNLEIYYRLTDFFVRSLVLYLSGIDQTDPKVVETVTGYLRQLEVANGLILQILDDYAKAIPSISSYLSKNHLEAQVVENTKPVSQGLEQELIETPLLSAEAAEVQTQRTAEECFDSLVDVTRLLHRSLSLRTLVRRSLLLTTHVGQAELENESERLVGQAELENESERLVGQAELENVNERLVEQAEPENENEGLVGQAEPENENEGLVGQAEPENENEGLVEAGSVEQVPPLATQQQLDQTLANAQTEFNEALEQARRNLAYLREKAKTDKNYKKAADKANDLYKSLEQLARLFFEDKRIVPEKFKEGCNLAINDARSVLEKHRGWSEIFAQIAFVTLSLCTLGGANFLSFVVTGSPHFFAAKPTKANQRLTELEKSLDEIHKLY